MANSDFLFTSSRDESVSREPALPFHQYVVGSQIVYFPKDQRAGGTWFATNGSKRSVCLLNGGFKPHVFLKHHQYRKSRGIVVLELFEFEDFKTFCTESSFENIEPFTMISVEKTAYELFVQEFRWTGEQGVLKSISANQPIIWSSVTLYTSSIIHAREEWFSEWQSNTNSSQQDTIIDFHRFAGNGNPKENLQLNAGDKKTVSICSLHVSEGISKAVYMDLLAESTTNYIIYH